MTTLDHHWPVVIAGPTPGTGTRVLDGIEFVPSMNHELWPVSELRRVPELSRGGLPVFWNHGDNRTGEELARVVCVQWNQPSRCVVGLLRPCGQAQREALAGWWLRDRLPALSMCADVTWLPSGGLDYVVRINRVASCDLVPSPALGGGFLDLPMRDALGIIEHYVNNGTATERAAAALKLERIKQKEGIR